MIPKAVGGVVAATGAVAGGGRGPDVCIEAVGMEPHSTGPDFLYDQVKQQLRLQTDRPTAIREAIYARHLATHPMRLDDGPAGYRMFKRKENGCVRVVFRP